MSTSEGVRDLRGALATDRYPADTDGKLIGSLGTDP